MINLCFRYAINDDEFSTTKPNGLICESYNNIRNCLECKMYKTSL